MKQKVTSHTFMDVTQKVTNHITQQVMGGISQQRHHHQNRHDEHVYIIISNTNIVNIMTMKS